MTDDPSDEETLLYNLVYCSRAVKTFDQADLDQLVQAAQQHNSIHSITGWLVYSHGVFFQWLEGIQDSVKQLMASISADSRHNTIVILSESEEIRSRVFSGWDMELVSAEDIRAVLFDAIDASTKSSSREALRNLLKELDSKGVCSE